MTDVFYITSSFFFFYLSFFLPSTFVTKRPQKQHIPRDYVAINETNVAICKEDGYFYSFHREDWSRDGSFVDGKQTLPILYLVTRAERAGALVSIAAANNVNVRVNAPAGRIFASRDSFLSPFFSFTAFKQKRKERIKELEDGDNGRLSRVDDRVWHNRAAISLARVQSLFIVRPRNARSISRITNKRSCVFCAHRCTSKNGKK